MPSSTATRIKQPTTNAARPPMEDTATNSHGTALATAAPLEAQLWEDCLADQQFIVALQERLTALQAREIRLRQEVLSLRARLATNSEGP